MDIESLMRTGQLHLGLELAGVQHVGPLDTRVVRSLAGTVFIEGDLAPLQTGAES
jgi:hypothetical protein